MCSNNMLAEVNLVPARAPGMSCAPKHNRSFVHYSMVSVVLEKKDNLEYLT